MMNEVIEFVKENLSRAVEQLLGRASGPLHMRLLIQPLMVTILSIRAGLKDAKEGNTVYLFGSMGTKEGRKQLFKTGWKAIGKVFIIAIVLDSVYQIVVLHTFYILQTLIVALCLAIFPYLLVRGIVTRVASNYYKKNSGKSE